MIKIKLNFVFVLSCFIYTSANASIANYQSPEILARANVSDGYNIPAMSVLIDSSPVINNRGDIAFKVVSVQGGTEQALWVKTLEDPNGKILYTSEDERYLTTPSLNELGKIAFSQFDDGVTDGLFVYDSKTFILEQVLKPDNLAIQNYTYPQIFNNNHIFFRATDDNDKRSFYEFSEKKLSKLITEGVENLGIKPSFLFRPSANEAGQIAFKARMGNLGEWDESNPDSIVLLSPSKDPKSVGMKTTIIASDHDTDSTSRYAKFGNGLSLSKSGMVAFIAILSNNQKSIVLSKDNVLTEFAIEGKNNISQIEMFTPKLNDNGIVLFRAKNDNGKRGLYLSNGVEVKRIIGEGDEIQTDLGAGAILFNPNFPGFSGDADMNDLGEIVFHCLVVSSRNEELGSAIFKMSPVK